jgi:cytochrome c-type biogenesis protein CcmH/NrfF
LESLRLELMCLVCEGNQLWDGAAEIIIRLANPEERMVWERDSDGALDRLTFLVSVSETNE